MKCQLKLVIIIFTGFGSNFLFTNALVTNTLNFTILRRGRVIGLLIAFFWVGSSVFSAIYEGIFHPVTAIEGNLFGYFVLGGTCFAVISILSLIFTRQYPIQHTIPELSAQSDSENKGLLDNIKRSDAKRNLPKLSHGDLSFLELWTNVDYHLVFWPSIFCNGIQFVIIFNMSTYFESFSMMDYIGKEVLGVPVQHFQAKALLMIDS